MIAQYFDQSSIAVEWQPSLPSSLSHSDTRLLCNLVIIGGGMLIRGGNLVLQSAPEMLAVEATGSRITLEDETLYILHGGASLDSLTPRTVQYYLSYALAREGGYRIQCTCDVSGCRIVAAKD